jgi:radical SAM protein with 4Fe4S-binding SPASM domain
LRLFPARLKPCPTFIIIFRRAKIDGFVESPPTVQVIVLMAKISPNNFFRELKQNKLYSKILYHNIVNRLHYKHGNRARILWLNIEFTSMCNLKCRMCALDRSQPRGSMDPKLFEKILNEINTSGRIKVDNIALWLGGETLLHPEFVKMLKILSLKRSEAKGFPYVTLLTNATLLHGEKANVILKTDAIDCIMFSIDGGTKESFESLRKGANWEDTLNNIREFLSQNIKSGKRLKTGLVSIVDPKINLSNEFLDLKKSVDKYLPRDFHNWTGSVELDVDIKRGVQRNGLCYPILRQMAIHWDGRVSPCCIDLNTRGPLGDLRKQKLYDVYHSEQRKFMINKMLKGLRKEIYSCRDCEH